MLNDVVKLDVAFPECQWYCHTIAGQTEEKKRREDDMQEAVKEIKGKETSIRKSEENYSIP
jgi:hypothetical protein